MGTAAHGWGLQGRCPVALYNVPKVCSSVATDEKGRAFLPPWRPEPILFQKEALTPGTGDGEWRQEVCFGQDGTAIGWWFRAEGRQAILEGGMESCERAELADV